MNNCCYCNKEIDINNCGNYHPVYDSSEYHRFNCYKSLYACNDCCIKKRLFKDHTCNSCGNIFYSIDEINQETHNCYYCDQQKLINRYVYKPDIVKFNKNVSNSLCIGVELEINGAKNIKDLYLNGKDVEKLFTTITDNDNIIKFVVLKKDASIGQMGFEMVSQPATIDYHIQNAPWKSFFKKCQLKGRRNCGLHFHVDKSYLNVWQGKFLDFFAHKNSWLIEKIAGRKFNRYCYCSQKGWDSCGHSRSRYEMLNYINPNTIEFRFFKSPKNYHQFMYRLEFTDAIVKFVRQFSGGIDIWNDNERILNSFIDFIKFNKNKYVHLNKYISCIVN